MSEQPVKLNLEEKLMVCIELAQKRKNDIQALSDECARLREALLKVKPELYCMDRQLIASGYKRGASVADAMRAMESALTPPEQEGGGR